MLDQSFSADNFRHILEKENLNGFYLGRKYFKDVAKVEKAISQCLLALRGKPLHLTPVRAEAYRKVLVERLDTLRKEKETKLSEELRRISEKILDPKFKIVLSNDKEVKGKRVYTVDDSAETYFALKQLQVIFNKSYGVKQSNRYAIVSQVKRLLDDKFPKLIIRTDIQDFYESVPHIELLRRINEESVISFTAKKILSQILQQYRTLSGRSVGLPRGIGISPYLAELYMRDFDASILSTPFVTYYGRYVDDIVVICTPAARKLDKKLLLGSLKKINEDFPLKRRPSKTRVLNFLSREGKFTFDFLGYEISFDVKGISLGLSTDKVDRIKTRLLRTVEAYKGQLDFNEKEARKLLIRRIKFLSGNTRLLNNKKHILVGIYFSNSLLTDKTVLSTLDDYLRELLRKNIPSAKLRSQLAQFTFLEGFEEKRFASFSTDQLKEMVSLWKNK